MALARPPHVPIRCFENICDDRQIDGALKDEIVMVLASAANVADATSKYGEWCSQVKSRDVWRLLQ